MANDIDLLALNAAISINSLIDFTPSGSKRTASIQLDVIQAIRTALLARGIDPNEPLPPAESVAQGGCGEEDDMLPEALVPHAKEWYRLCERRFAVDKIMISGELAEAIVEAMGRPRTPTPATGSGGEAAIGRAHDSLTHDLAGEGVVLPPFELMRLIVRRALKATHPAPAGGDAGEA